MTDGLVPAQGPVCFRRCGEEGSDSCTSFSKRWGGAGLVPLGTALLVLAACGREPARTSPERQTPAGSVALLDLPQRILFDGPLLVVPGTRWDRHTPDAAPAAGGRWRFRTFAKILCEVREPVTDTLEIGFRPDAATAGFDFRISWDGEDIEAASVRRDGDLRWITVSPAALAPGSHELLVRRVHPPGTFRSARHDNTFHDLRVHHGGREQILRPADVPRYELIAQFLQHGVMGRDQERRSGWLATAPGRHLLQLPEPIVGGRFEPQNFSARPAVFEVKIGDRRSEARLEPGERGEIRIEALGDGSELHLEIRAGDAAEDGRAEVGTAGPFLWGMPTLVPAAPRDPPPPVILVTLDTTRRDAVSPYSGRTDVTPVLAELASRATVFEQAYSTAPWTLPSHASIFTGLYPSKHGAGVSDVQLPAGAETLAGLLRRRGYLTAGFSAGELSSSRFGLAQGFHYYRNPDQFETLGNRLADYVDAFLDRYADHPLFLFVNYFDPHAVFRAPEEFQARLGVADLAGKIRGLPVWDDLLAGQMGAWRLAVEGEAPITPEVGDYLRAAYLAEVAFTDQLLGRLFDRLRALGLYERSLIVVTADHGELLGEGGYVSHGARLDPELVEIPMIVKWPASGGRPSTGRDPRRRVGELVSLVDLFPTVLETAGIDSPPSDGRPLQGDPSGSDRRSFLLLEEHEFLIHPLPKFMKVSRRLFGVQRPDFRHLVWDEGQACERRRQGVWQAEACTANRERVLSAIEAELGVVDPEVTAGDMSDEVRESLKALGYL